MRHGILLAILLSCAGNVVVGGQRELAAASGGSFRRGDVNGDEAADISDAVWVFGYLFLGGATPACLDAADINDDGAVDLSDGVFLLNHLFQGGPAPPSPSPRDACPGRDPTPDGLVCSGGEPGAASPPSADAYPVVANAPGVRQRSRTRLPVKPGTATYQVLEGTSFAVLVEATSSRISRVAFALSDPTDPLRGNPATLTVTCDGPLGDPGDGGAAAGENLAPWLFRDLDGWEDPIYLIEHAALSIAGGGPLAPAPGLYRFAAQVTDEACATSAPATFALEVLPSRAPELFAWLERGMAPAGVPEPHHPGTGNARAGRGDGFLLVVEGFPNGAAGSASPAPDPATFRAAASPAFGPGADVTGLFERDPSAPARFFARLEPGAVLPGEGNTTFTFEIGTGAPGELRSVPFTLEREVSYASQVQAVWDAECSGCHERPQPEKGLELVAPGVPPGRLWRNIVNVYAAEPAISSIAPYLVRPYFPEQSYLLHKLLGTHRDPGVAGTGERMPLNATTYLPEGTLHWIRSWIAQGAGSD
ncbi:MAG: hypothetical protein HY721_25585 [Planctomycetes bacterium]|nr:hypothetical protein [Planctomycetota bacterium]